MKNTVTNSVINGSMYVCQLTTKDRDKLEKYLMRIDGMDMEGLDNLMNGRLSDMEEVVSLEQIKRILGK